MKFAALISGGKDSIFNILECLNQGHELVALINLHPPLEKDELDSYMYQTVGHEAINYISLAIGDIPLYRYEISGTAVSTNLEYTQNLNNSYDTTDEVEDLFKAILVVKKDFEDLKGISSGAILSNYQRSRVENVCERLDLISLAFMWQRSQVELLDSMLKCSMNPIIIKIAALGLNDKDHLGKPLKIIAEDIKKKSEEFGLNPCGEGGEYETLTLDAPFFQKLIEIKSSHIIVETESDYAPVKYLKIDSMELKKKSPEYFRNYKEFYGSDLCTKFNLKRRTNPKEILSELKSELQQINDTETWDLSDFEIGSLILKIITATSILSTFDQFENATVNALNEVFAKMKKSMVELNSSMNQLVYCILCIPNMEHIGTINSIIYKWFSGYKIPGLTYIQSNSPNRISLHCYINCSRNFKSTHLRIQSYSHWTPANIGNFSQAVSLSDDTDLFCFLSGQIAVHSEDLELISSTIEEECLLGLRHITRLLWSNYGLGWDKLSFMICYCTESSNMIVCQRVFHSLICAEIIDRNYCLCDRVCWVTVCRLPKSANIEWQPLFSRNRFLPLKRSGMTLGNDLIILETCNEELIKINNHAAVIYIDSYLDGISVMTSGAIHIKL